MSLVPIFGAALWYSQLSSDPEEDPMTEETLAGSTEGGSGDTSGKTYLYYVGGDRLTSILMGLKSGNKIVIGTYRSKSKAISKGNELIAANPETYAWKTGYGS